jgi:hypothetical protein
MMVNAPQPRPIDRPDQLASLASPLRQEIVDVISAAGPCAIADVAGLLGRPADRLYFHFKHLCACGLLREVDSRKNGRHVAAVFDLAHRPMRLKYRPQDAANVEGVRGVFDGVLRLARRDFRRALESGEAVVEGATRDTWGGRVKGWLTDAQIKEVNQKVEEIWQLVGSARPRPGARPIALTLALAPESDTSAGAAARSGRKQAERSTRT